MLFVSLLSVYLNISFYFSYIYCIVIKCVNFLYIAFVAACLLPSPHFTLNEL